MQTRAPGSAVAWEQWVGGTSVGCLQITAFSDNNMALSCPNNWEVALFLSECLLDCIIIIIIIIMAVI